MSSTSTSAEHSTAAPHTRRTTSTSAQAKKATTTTKTAGAIGAPAAAAVATAAATVTAATTKRIDGAATATSSSPARPLTSTPVSTNTSAAQPHAARTMASAAALVTTAQQRVTRLLGAVSATVRAWCAQHKRTLLLAGAGVSACVALRGGYLVLRVLRQARMATFLRGLERDVVHLFVHPRWSHGPNLFPACVKVETFLRLANIPYIVHFTNDSTLSPNGRLPFIVYNGTALADSEFVVQYLSEQFAVTLDRALTPEAQAKGVFVRHLVETSLHYGLMRATYVDHPQFMTRVFADEFGLEPLVAGVVVRSIRSMTISQLNTIGYGDLRQTLYEEELMRDVRAIETLLGEGGAGAYVCGSRTPSSYDCAVYAWVHICIELGECGNAALAYAARSRVLRDYVQRVTQVAFPDMAQLHTSAPTQRFTQPRHAVVHAAGTVRSKRAA